MNSKVRSSLVTLSEMLFDRGYDKESKILANLVINDKMIFNIDIDDTFRIIYNLSKKIKIPELKKTLMEENFKKYIIVTLDSAISPANIKSIYSDQNLSDYDVQFFPLNRLTFNITKHNLVPKHVLINNEAEIKAIMEKYSVKSKAQLPIILKSDPIAMYLDAKPGNLVMIKRISPSAGEHIVYRYVI